MTDCTIIVTDSHTGKIVEVVSDARIQDRMRLRVEYQGLEHDGRYLVAQTKRDSNPLNQAAHYA